MLTRIIYPIVAVLILAIAVVVNSLGEVGFFSIGAAGELSQTAYGWPFVMCEVMSHGVGPNITRDFRFTTKLFAQPYPHLGSYIAIIPATFNLAWWCVCGGLATSLADRRQRDQSSRLPRYSLAQLILLQGLIAAAVAGHYAFR